MLIIMGEVIGLEENLGEVIAQVLINKREFIKLKNNFKEIGIFSGDVEECKAKMKRRGIYNKTHYIKLPLGIKKKKREEWRKVSVQRITQDSVVYYLFKFEKN